MLVLFVNIVLFYIKATRCMWVPTEPRATLAGSETLAVGVKDTAARELLGAGSG